jgi:hypothetical protein
VTDPTRRNGNSRNPNQKFARQSISFLIVVADDIVVKEKKRKEGRASEQWGPTYGETQTGGTYERSSNMIKERIKK